DTNAALILSKLSRSVFTTMVKFNSVMEIAAPRRQDVKTNCALRNCPQIQSLRGKDEENFSNPSALHFDVLRSFRVRRHNRRVASGPEHWELLPIRLFLQR